MGKQYVDTNTKSFHAAAALPKYSLVAATANAGEVEAAAGTGGVVGSMCEATFAAGDRVSVQLISKAGTLPVIASGVIARGALVYLATAGKVGTTNTNTVVGTALDAAAADGDIIEVLPA